MKISTAQSDFYCRKQKKGCGVEEKNEVNVFIPPFFSENGNHGNFRKINSRKKCLLELVTPEELESTLKTDWKKKSEDHVHKMIWFKKVLTNTSNASNIQAATLDKESQKTREKINFTLLFISSHPPPLNRRIGVKETAKREGKYMYMSTNKGAKKGKMEKKDEENRGWRVY